MGLEFLSKSVFWIWYSLQPAPTPLQEVSVVPNKQILHATWIEPASLRDKPTPPALRKPAEIREVTRLNSKKTPAVPEKPRKPLWNAAKTWELPPILWAGFEGFIAAGLGIVSLLKP